MEFRMEANRIWLPNAQGKMIAEVLFPTADHETVDITHTFVDKSLSGQGIAGKLMEAVAAQLRQNKRKARLTCSYAIHWFAKHPEYHDILA